MRHLIFRFLPLICFFCTAMAAQGALKNNVDGEFVTVSGKVTKVFPQSFTLKSGESDITVEMDDWDWDADGYKLMKGDQVVVNGKVDNDFLEKKKVEAGSVYVKGLDTYFYASSADEEGAPYLTTVYSYVETLPENAVVDLQGKVVSVSGREFVVDTGFRRVTVNTADLIYDPTDDQGAVQVNVGDRVRVSGKVDDTFFDRKEISANMIREL